MLALALLCAVSESAVSTNEDAKEDGGYAPTPDGTPVPTPVFESIPPSPVPQKDSPCYAFYNDDSKDTATGGPFPGASTAWER